MSASTDAAAASSASPLTRALLASCYYHEEEMPEEGALATLEESSPAIAPAHIMLLCKDEIQLMMQKLIRADLSRLGRCSKALMACVEHVNGAAHRLLPAHVFDLKDLPRKEWPKMRYEVWLNHTIDRVPRSRQLARLQTLIVEKRVDTLVIRAGFDRPVREGDMCFAMLIPFFEWLGGRALADRPPVVRLQLLGRMTLPASVLPLVTLLDAHSLFVQEVGTILGMPNLVELRASELHHYNIYGYLANLFNDSSSTLTLRTKLRRVYVEVPSFTNREYGLPVDIDVPFRHAANLTRLHVYMAAVDNAAWLADRLMPELLLMPKVTDLRITARRNCFAMRRVIYALIAACASITSLTVELYDLPYDRRIFSGAHANIMQRMVRARVMRSVAPRVIDFTLSVRVRLVCRPCPLIHTRTRCSRLSSSTRGSSLSIARTLSTLASRRFE
jgi:hypothetical protein